MSEPRKDFHQSLQEIENHVVELFAFVAEDLSVATAALLNSDGSALRVVAGRQATIDSIYRDVETLVNQQLLLQAPVATDLRLLVSVLRILPDHERAHRLVFHIAEQATHALSEDLTPRIRGLVQQMGDTAADMWNRAANAWYARDRSALATLEVLDQDQDGLHSALVAELASGSTRTPVAMDMTLVARYYERLADHAVNIARRVVYLAGNAQKDQTDQTDQME
jgi:phosphate transport system protein